MAVASSQTMTSKGLHPFFVGIRNSTNPSDHHQHNGESLEVEDSAHRTEHVAKTDPKCIEDVGTSVSGTRARKGSPSMTPIEQAHAQPQLSSPRSSKRRKLEQPTISDLPVVESDRKVSSPEASSLDKAILPEKEAVDKQTTPPRETQTLKLNGKGKFSTPKKPRGAAQEPQIEDVEGSTVSKGRGRRRARKSLLVAIKYGNGEDDRRLSVGQQINDILGDVTSASASSVSESTKVPLHADATNPSKPTHPFFSSKADRRKLEDSRQSDAQRATQTSEACQLSPGKIRSFTTPVKRTTMPPWMINLPGPSHDSQSSPIPSKAFSAMGTREPLWPPKGFHSHGRSSEFDSALLPTFRPRAQKQRPQQVPSHEDILLPLAFQAKSFARSEDGATTGSSQVKLDLPERSVETRTTLRNRLAAELTMTRSGLEAGFSNASPSKHPAVASLLGNVGAALTAYDKAECESQTWAQKYAPRQSSHVLQPEREMSVLRQWLAGLTVDIVENRATMINQNRGKLGSRDASTDRGDKARRKRRKRVARELDDFLVDSDDEGELSTMPDDEPTEHGDAAGDRSMIRENFVSAASKTMNAVLVSGPHGCGKTASVYAVARELGYEVFEINAASKRSGKDILDKVGDMALNHQVRQRQDADVAEASDLEQFPPQKTTLNSFFKSKPGCQAHESKPKRKAAEVFITKPPAKKQTQALILLDEVDVLFDDDKLFWETVIDLAIQSRRPIIMTCQDEALVPLDNLSLHAILRLKNPPVDLAASYLVALAASEGHVLSTSALESLYKEKRLDLRASITVLQFWCQMAVGDEKGGLGWALQRWPKDCDLDEFGERRHVVSNGTFRSGMGVLGRLHDDEVGSLDALIAEAWTQYGLDPLQTLHESIDKPSLRSSEGEGHGREWSLESLQALAETTSLADTMSSVDLPTAPLKSDVLDMSLPPITNSVRHDATMGYRLLHADPKPEYTQTSSNLRLYLAVRARQTLGSPRTQDAGAQSPKSIVANHADELLRKIESRPATASVAQLQARTKITSAIEPLLYDGGILLSPGLHADIAPYARSIVAYDLALESHRTALSSANGKDTDLKALRKTRAARSALEGGQRAITRRERWFGPDADYQRIMATAGSGWPRVEGDILAQQGRALELAKDTPRDEEAD